MNEQIKVKELPEGYFVTDKHYQSGNKEFYSKGKIYTIDSWSKENPHSHISGNSHLVEKWINNKTFETIYPERIIGTRHIQLIFVNVEVDKDGCVWGEDGQSIYGYVDKNIHNQIKENNLIGKDFFIYEVSEEK